MHGYCQLHKNVSQAFPRCNVMQEQISFSFVCKNSIICSRKSCDEYLQVDPSGEIVVLSQSVPWSQHLFELEKEQNIQPSLKYIIFGDGSFRIRSIPVDNGSFVCRYLHGITQLNYS